MDSKHWGWECMLQLQEAEDRKTPAATTWAAEFCLRTGECREFLGSWINSGAIHEAQKRRSTQVTTCSFPCGKWLHMIGARASSQCELCRRERRHGQEAIEHLPKKNWHTFKVHGVMRKRRASLGLTGVVDFQHLLCAITMGRRTSGH